MQVVVLGLWHLGCVTAACLARHHQVVGLDFDEPVLAGLRDGQAPLHEPGLNELLMAGVTGGTLTYSSEVKVAADAEILWVCYDTPVDDNDQSDLQWVHDRMGRVLPSLRAGTVVLLSSQLPVGTCAGLAAQYPHLQFACSPENLRLGKAIEAFEKPARIIVGASTESARHGLTALLTPLGAPLIWMRPESAEMVKHALNSFLALSVAYINEIAILSESVGADAQEVAAGLKSDPRIGVRAYLAPGGPFAGGTLARDVVTLTKLGLAKGRGLSVIPAIKVSNDRHRGWALRKVLATLEGVKNPTVAVLGLAYTTGTNTLRRSSAVELCRQLATAHVAVRAYDPAIITVDDEHRDLILSPTVASAMHAVHAVVICTGWPELRDHPWPTLLAGMVRPVVIDADRFLSKTVADLPRVVYISVGRP